LTISEDNLLEERDKIILSIPLFNHSLHTLPAIMVVVDLINWKYVRPKMLTGLSLASLFTTLYLGWIHYVFYTRAVWPYPILKKLSTFNRNLFIAGCILIVFLMYLVTDVLNLAIHSLYKRGDSNKVVTRSAKQQKSKKTK
jgi:hypothetical protein